jgi:transposase InsO family protein
MGVSERFACRVTGQHRTTQRHQAQAETPTDPDAGLRSWLRDYAKAHPRWGFRRAYHDARAEGGSSITRNCNGSGARKGCGCRSGPGASAWAASTAPGAGTADAPNKVWAVDFQFDSTTDGRPVKIASIIDEHTRECLGGLVPARSPAMT